MAVLGNSGLLPNYEPNSFSGLYHTNMTATTFSPEELEGLNGRHIYEFTNIDFAQAGDLYRLMSDEEKTDLVDDISDHLKNVKRHNRECQISYFKGANLEYSRRVEQTILSFGSEAQK
ncbi:hypothetical protein A0J61_04630 [Choanephora cucurbitarum]|uniref:Catalase immune-responsive domain-containing protein n=1 Tax=Choanephora cucurbitarum TaxID=101091 RepID=A0A1C7NEY8_9FUNG|nr:hypothetical protein A0J61_04630 [Choanephora cucurbitarum]